VIGDADSGLPEALRPVFSQLCQEIKDLGDRILEVERQIEKIAEQTPVVERVRSIPGIGLLTLTALVAFIGDIHRFPSGRRFSSYLGLTPRERSSGSTRRLGRISKRGDSYLRTLLIHGTAPSSVMPRRPRTTTDFAPGLFGSKKPSDTTRPRWLWPTSSPASSGPSGKRTLPSFRASPSLPERTLTPELPVIDVMAQQVEPTQGQADNNDGLKRPLSTIGYLGRGSSSWPGATSAPPKRPKIRLQSTVVQTPSSTTSATATGT
jgi:hypothetical protein